MTGQRFGEHLRRLRESQTVTIVRDGRAGGHWRDQVPLSQNELALRAGLNPGAINKLEQGKNGTAKRETALKLAEALGLDPLGQARLLVAAGLWPWPDLDDEALDFVLAAAAAIVAGDWRAAAQSGRDADGWPAIERRRQQP